MQHVWVPGMLHKLDSSHGSQSLLLPALFYNPALDRCFVLYSGFLLFCYMKKKKNQSYKPHFPTADTTFLCLKDK